jgi:hypothetical protein
MKTMMAVAAFALAIESAQAEDWTVREPDGSYWRGEWNDGSGHLYDPDGNYHHFHGDIDNDGGHVWDDNGDEYRIDPE